MGDDYEILPHQELEYLRKEVERLKSNPYGDTETGQTLLDSMNSLTASINKLLSVLETANDEMVRDYEENREHDRLKRLEEHNEKLAEGMVAVGNLVKQVLDEQKRSTAFQGGFEELSDFSTATKTPKKAKKTTGKNPFGGPGEDVYLDKDLPRQSFKQMDAEPQKEEDDLPSTKDLPPPPKGLDDAPKPPR